MGSNKHVENFSGFEMDEDRYRFLVEHSGELISAHRPGDWAYTAVNPAIKSFSGYTPEEVIGRSAYDMYHPEDAEAMKKKLIPAIYKDGIRTFRYRHKHKDGSYGWVESTHRSIRDPDTGELKEIIAVSRDISAQMAAEQALREQQAELAHMSRLMTMGEMASGLAHEINQPLATTLNYANGALRRLQQGKVPDPQRLESLLKAIVKQSQRAAEIVKRLRGLVKKTPFQRSDIELGALCSDVVGFFQHEVALLSGEIRVEKPDKPVVITADRVQIEQVLVNLIRNAIDAYSDSDTEEKLIVVRLQAFPGSAMICVMDNAGGVDASLVESIFEPYVTSKSDGLGMGLSISRSIIEAHGGRISLEETRDFGTVFRMVLPLTNSLREKRGMIP